jgi:hypothetical protein
MYSSVDDVKYIPPANKMSVLFPFLGIYLYLTQQLTDFANMLRRVFLDLSVSTIRMEHNFNDSFILLFHGISGAEFFFAERLLEFESSWMNSWSFGPVDYECIARGHDHTCWAFRELSLRFFRSCPFVSKDEGLIIMINLVKVTWLQSKFEVYRVQSNLCLFHSLSFSKSPFDCLDDIEPAWTFTLVKNGWSRRPEAHEEKHRKNRIEVGKKGVNSTNVDRISIRWYQVIQGVLVGPITLVGGGDQDIQFTWELFLHVAEGHIFLVSFDIGSVRSSSP